MDLTRILPILLILPAAGRGAAAFATDSAEAQAARIWVRERFAENAADFPFSFTYGGRESALLLRSGSRTCTHRRLGEQRTGHVLTWTDEATGLAVTCTAIEYGDVPAVEWVLELRNAGRDDTPILEEIMPLDLRAGVAPGKPCRLHYSRGDGNSAESFAPLEQDLAPVGSPPVVLAPKGGRSSDGCLPFFNLQCGDGGRAVAIGWSGQWEARFDRVGPDALRIRAGQQLTHLVLHPGEVIRTPRILLAFWTGDEPLRGNNLMRRALLAHYLPRRGGQLVYAPVCASVNWTDPDGSYEAPHLRVLPALAERGIEVFWSDMDPQQWYPLGFPTGTGTWEPDPAKYPRGLKPVGDAVRAAGLEYLLWFEPERVHPGTRIDREHPEWVMKPAGEWSQLFALHDPAARRWLTDYIDVQITQARLAWVRWDFNIEPLGFWRRNDPPDRQGITEIRHIEGLYAMWDELRARHPGLVIDNCASGGRRIDLESCTRGLPLWHSDMQCSGKPGYAADQLQNAGLFRWVPMHGCGNFDYEPSYAFRSAMTMGNILAPSNARGRLSTADPETAEAVRRTVAVYRRVRPWMTGDFYPLTPHEVSDKAWFAYQFHRPDLAAGMAVVFRRKDCSEAGTTLRLREVDPAATYETRREGDATAARVVGGTLLSLRMELAAAPGSAILYYRKLP
jgi:alpha-galactosidase